MTAVILDFDSVIQFLQAAFTCACDHMEVVTLLFFFFKFSCSQRARTDGGYFQSPSFALRRGTISDGSQSPCCTSVWDWKLKCLGNNCLRLTLDYNLIYHAIQTLQALKHASCLSMATFQRSSNWRAALSCVFMVYVILSVDMETPVKIVGKLLLVTNLAATKRGVSAISPGIKASETVE